MEIHSAKWLSDMGMEDPNTFFNQYQMNPFEYSLDDLSFQAFSCESYSSYPDINGSQTETYQTATIERPLKQLRTDSWNSCTTDNQHMGPKTSSSSSNSQIISFNNSNYSTPAISQQYYGLDGAVKPKDEAWSTNGTINFSPVITQASFEDQCVFAKQGQGNKRAGSVTRSPLHAQDHVLAERKRREKLSQRFIALSTLLPGLKKTDKASVLGDAIKYLKQLQERLKTLEDQTAKKTIESAILVKKSQICVEEETSSSDENFDAQCDLPLPEIEARVSEDDVLIRIHCEKKKGCIVNILGEIEKLHLTVVSSNALPFGKCTLDITVVAKMDAEFSMTAKDLAKNIRQAILQLI